MNKKLTKNEKRALAVIVCDREAGGVSDLADALGTTERKAEETLNCASSAIRKLYATTERVQ